MSAQRNNTISGILSVDYDDLDHQPRSHESVEYPSPHGNRLAPLSHASPNQKLRDGRGPHAVAELTYVAGEL